MSSGRFKRASATPGRRSGHSSGRSRRAVVLASLLGVLGLTSGLLLAMRSNPLRPDALFAVQAVDSLEVIFNTEVAAGTQRWKYIYIHQSATPAGGAQTLTRPDGSLGDHFVIGNGDGAEDGELLIDQHWLDQEAVSGPKGVRLDPACISICLVGDLDQNAPTDIQYHRLCQLVETLQARYHIPTDEVSWLTTPSQQSGRIGHRFPSQRFHQELLPAQSITP